MCFFVSFDDAIVKHLYVMYNKIYLKYIFKYVLCFYQFQKRGIFMPDTENQTVQYEEWEDHFLITKEKVHLTYNELKIPGLRLFGMLHQLTASEPLKMHIHSSAFEITFVTQGEMAFYAANKDYTVPGGSAFISYPDEPHSTNQIPLTPKQIYWFQLDISDPENFLFLSPPIARKLIDDLYGIQKHIVSTDNKETTQIMKHIYDQCMGERNSLEIASYIIIFLQRLIYFSQNEIQHRSFDIDLAVSYINEHITEEMNLTEIARQSMLSLPQFKQKFKSYTGTSPRNYINIKKIEYSKDLLRNGTSITNTAMQLSFNTSTYFATVFKKYTLLTPSEYVAKCRNKRNASPYSGDSSQ